MFCVLSWKDLLNSLWSHILYSILNLCGGFIEQSFSLLHWHHLKVCESVLCVCECVCVSILVSLCASLAVGSTVWFLAGGSQLLAAQLKQWIPTREREREGEWRRDINKQRRSEKKRGRQTGRERDTPEGGNRSEKKNRQTQTEMKRQRERDWKCVFAHGSISAVVFGFSFLLPLGISDLQIHTPASSSSSSSSFTLWM